MRYFKLNYLNGYCMKNGAEGFIQNFRNCLREMNLDFQHYKIRLLFLESCFDI